MDPWPQNVVAREVAAANEDALVKVAEVAAKVATVDTEVAAKDTRGWDPWPQNVVVKEVVAANEDASVKVAAKVATVDTEVVAADGEVVEEPVKTVEKDNNVAIGDSKDAGVDGADDGFFDNLSDKEMAALEVATQSSSKIGNSILELLPNLFSQLLLILNGWLSSLYICSLLFCNILVRYRGKVLTP